MRRRRPMFDPGYRAESELCEDVKTWARAAGCHVHAECSGWDMLIVVPETGEQVGVQAKLKPSLKLVEQALAGAKPNRGPDVVALAIPMHDASTSAIAAGLEMTMIIGAVLRPRGHERFEDWMRRARRRTTVARCWAPEVEVDLPAGVPSPRTVSPWKFAAARVCARLRAGDVMTRAEFAAAGLRVDSWVTSKWVVRAGKVGRVTGYRMRTAAEGGRALPDAEFPEIVAALGLPSVGGACYGRDRKVGR